MAFSIIDRVRFQFGLEGNCLGDWNDLGLRIFQEDPWNLVLMLQAAVQLESWFESRRSIKQRKAGPKKHRNRHQMRPMA